MNIVVLADPLDNQSAGVHFYARNLIKALLKVDKKNNYTFIHKKENKFFEATNHIVIPRKKIKGYETYRKFYLIPKLIKEIKADLVLGIEHFSAFRLSKDIKKVVIIHDITPILFPQFHIKKNVIFHKLFLSRIIRKSDLILTVSENTKSDIMKKYASDLNIKVINAGVFVENKITKNRLIKSPYILYLGTIEPRKNLNILIDTFLSIFL